MVEAPTSWQDVYVVAQTYSYSPKPTHSAYIPVGDGQCVPFIQSHGYGAYRGNAEDWKVYINSDVPVVGGVVVLDESERGHLALILAIVGDKVWIVEQNYEGVGIVSYRTIDVGYAKIAGYVVK